MNDDPRTWKLRTRQDLEKSIKMLQRYANLPETGRMDAATIALMGKSRCGVADYGNYNSDNTRRKKRYTLQGTYWKKRVSQVFRFCVNNQTLERMPIATFLFSIWKKEKDRTQVYYFSCCMTYETSVKFKKSTTTYIHLGKTAKNLLD